MISSISISELSKIIDTVELIDIRSVEKYNSNHIPSAKNIPFEVLMLKPDRYLEKNKTYYISCQKGSRSIKACQMLTQLGYHVVNVNGGYEGWILEK